MCYVIIVLVWSKDLESKINGNNRKQWKKSIRLFQPHYQPFVWSVWRDCKKIWVAVAPISFFYLSLIEIDFFAQIFWCKPVTWIRCKIQFQLYKPWFITESKSKFIFSLPNFLIFWLFETDKKMLVLVWRLWNWLAS